MCFILKFTTRPDLCKLSWKHRCDIIAACDITKGQNRSQFRTYSLDGKESEDWTFLVSGKFADGRVRKHGELSDREIKTLHQFQAESYKPLSGTSLLIKHRQVRGQRVNSARRSRLSLGAASQIGLASIEEQAGMRHGGKWEEK